MDLRTWESLALLFWLTLLWPQPLSANAKYTKGTYDSCQPISFCSHNFGALTPQAEPERYTPKFQYIVDWPGLLINKKIRDAGGRGMVVPGFETPAQGAGIWWYWLRVRAGGVGYAKNATVTLRDIAWDVSGLRGTGVEPKAYWTGYGGHAARYFGPGVGLDTPLSLADGDAVWALARVVFHHEAGVPVTETTLDRKTFDEGRKLAETRIGQRR